MIDSFTEELWQETLRNQLAMEGWHTAPNVSCNPIPIPFGVKRDSEVILMSFLYKQNLLNSFLFHFDRQEWTSPLCICGLEEQDALHLLTSCVFIDSRIRQRAQELLELCNNTHDDRELTANPFALLNCSRDPQFIDLCLEIVETENLQLRKKINLNRRKQ